MRILRNTREWRRQVVRWLVIASGRIELVTFDAGEKCIYAPCQRPWPRNSGNLLQRRVPLACRQWEARQQLRAAPHASGLKDEVSSNFWHTASGCLQALRSPGPHGTSHWRHASGTRLEWQLDSCAGSCPHPRPFSRGEKGADLHAARADDCGWAIAFGKFCSSFDKSDSFNANNILLPSPMGRGAGGEGVALRSGWPACHRQLEDKGTPRLVTTSACSRLRGESMAPGAIFSP